MAIGLSALQTLLEEGNKDDWFQSSFIVRLAVVAVVFLTAFIWIELTVEEAAGRPLAAEEPQFQRRHDRQRPGRLRPVRLGLRAAAISGPGAGLQRRADRHGAGLDRPAAAPAHPARPDADEALRRPLHHLRRHRPVRRFVLHEHPHVAELFRRPAVLAQCRACRRPGPGHHAADRHRDDEHPAEGRGQRLGPVQHAAQSRRRRRHRRARHHRHQARAVPLEHHRPGGDARRAKRCANASTR